MEGMRFVVSERRKNDALKNKQFCGVAAMPNPLRYVAKLRYNPDRIARNNLYGVSV
jgi:hypothetical protein